LESNCEAEVVAAGAADDVLVDVSEAEGEGEPVETAAPTLTTEDAAPTLTTDDAAPTLTTDEAPPVAEAEGATGDFVEEEHVLRLRGALASARFELAEVVPLDASCAAWR
jgi:hypothetical protein